MDGLTVIIIYLIPLICMFIYCAYKKAKGELFSNDEFNSEFNSGFDAVEIAIILSTIFWPLVLPFFIICFIIFYSWKLLVKFFQRTIKK